MQNDGFGIQTMARDRGWGLRGLSFLTDLRKTTASFWQRVSERCHLGGDRRFLARRLQLSTEWTGYLRGSNTTFLSCWIGLHDSYQEHLVLFWLHFQAFCKWVRHHYPQFANQEAKVETGNTPSPESNNEMALKTKSLRSTRSLIHWATHLK